jgi:hypothetical protein
LTTLWILASKTKRQRDSARGRAGIGITQNPYDDDYVLIDFLGDAQRFLCWGRLWEVGSSTFMSENVGGPTQTSETDCCCWFMRCWATTLERPIERETARTKTKNVAVIKERRSPLSRPWPLQIVPRPPPENSPNPCTPVAAAPEASTTTKTTPCVRAVQLRSGFRFDAKYPQCGAPERHRCNTSKPSPTDSLRNDLFRTSSDHVRVRLNAAKIPSRSDLGPTTPGGTIGQGWQSYPRKRSTTRRP